MDELYLNLNLLDIDPLLERLVQKARARYMDAGSSLSECFLRLYQKDGFQIHGALKQTEIFDKKVHPILDEGKTAYLWSSRCKYEWITGPDAHLFQPRIRGISWKYLRILWNG